MIIYELMIFYLHMFYALLNLKLHVLYWQLHMEVNCVLLSTYTFTYLCMIFTPLYINDSTAQVTHFSSTLILRID